MSGLVQYDRLTVRERIIRQMKDKIEGAEFGSTGIRPTVIRREIPDDFDRASGAMIAILEGREVFNTTMGKRENTLTVILQIAVPVSEGEEAQTVLNLVAGELLELFKGRLQSPDDPKLAADMVPVDLTANVDDDDGGNVAAGFLEFTVLYRTAPTGPFDA